MISGVFPKTGEPWAFVLVAVVVEGVNDADPALLPFVIDTGAEATVIHGADAVHRLRMSLAALNPRTWPRHERLRAGGVGGSMYMWRKRALLGFQHDNGSWTEIVAPIGIGDRSTAGLPSILGLDVLVHFRLVVDGRDSVTLDLR